MKITSTEAIAADGKYIHRVGDSAYFTRCTLLNGDTTESFEEVDTIPTEPPFDYDAEIEALIAERYTIKQELAIQRQRDNKPQEFAEYNAYCEECKNHVKEMMTNYPRPKEEKKNSSDFWNGVR